MGLRELQEIRDKRNDPKIKKAYSIAKISKKRAKKMLEDKATAEADAEFYKVIWAASAHKCQNCGCNLGRTAHTFMFHHLLEKRNYPEFRHTPENIMVLCLECHSKAETNIDSAPKIKQRRIEVEKLLICS